MLLAWHFAQTHAIAATGAAVLTSSTERLFPPSRIQSYSVEEVDMRTTKQMSVTLPHEMADMVRAKVVSGEYASESEVIREGLRALAARDRAVDAWLRDQVAPAYDRLLADPESALSACEVRARLASLRDQ